MIRLDSFFSTLYNSWTELEAAINRLPSAQERGEVFEQFVYLYLFLKKDYYQINELYRFGDLPEEHRNALSLENTDYGIDGVWILTDGSYAAYQAKFRESRQSATIRELATFWTEAERAHHKYVIANSVNLPRQAGKHGQSILVDSFEALDNTFFNDVLLLYQGQLPARKEPYEPREHQQRMIGKILTGFQENDRGKLVAACGAGKTLVALWSTEALASKSVLFLAPSLALIKQTLEAWTQHSKHKFIYLCVCSDQTVVSEVDSDLGDYEVSEVDFPVTTDPEVIKKFLALDNEYKYIFTTYQSAFAVAEALRGSNFCFDLGIFDEAHKTAGQKETEMFSIALKDEAIKIEKRLFMTATERLIAPRIKRKAREANRTIFSMDDRAIYGPLFDRYSFGEAINDNVISDYRIILTGINKEEVLSMIENNTLLVDGSESTENLVTAENIFKQIVLAKAMKEFGLSKSVSFHSSVKRARGFINGNNSETFGLQDLMVKLWPDLEQKKKYFSSIDGSMSTGERKKKLRDFENADFSVISNAKCLTEGVDVPIIDSIYFVDPKTSLVDIVQACGRALRKGASTTLAHFIVPVLLYPSDADLSYIDDDRFETLLNLIQALRDQDERLADIIDRINMQVVTGQNGPSTGDLPLQIDIPREFDLTAFCKEVQLRILEANGEPTVPENDTDFRIRRSAFRKTVKPIGDYAHDTMFNNLVLPTLQKFPTLNASIPINAVRINNNNVSHTVRLNLINKVGNSYVLTALGKKLLLKEIDNKEVMRLAMLHYNCGTESCPLYPYRAILEILITTNSINYIEFLFGIYPIENTNSDSISDSINIINDIREKYPDLISANTENKRRILDQLNSDYHTNFTVAEAWGSTTANNKFIYFKQNLSLFHGITGENNRITIAEEAKSEILDLLEASR